ncbi:MAG: HlyD family efflux transporter periplasmic adaptor subunit [Pseudomonadota bacterium]
MPKRNTAARIGAIGIAALALIALGYAFWPKPTLVDLGVATRAAMQVTINEEARTRVRDAYVVSAPIAGRLLRVAVEPGDVVVGGETVIARMLPAPPSAIDVRTREQARAGVSAAQAGQRVARADLNSALASQDLADAQVARLRKLASQAAVSQAALDQAEREKRAADAAVDTARAAIAMREAELASARAQLMEFAEGQPGSQSTSSDAISARAIPLTAPSSGRILRILQESETTVTPGQAIVEIGDTSDDLEVVAELISTDAVQVSPGDRVIIDNWGGAEPLSGVVELVEPWGFTKYSALGVEEQRVNTIIRFTDPLERRANLGHGYRVEARIVIWEDESALTVPSSALFRHNGGWAALAVVDGVTAVRSLTIGRNNGELAEVVDGINEDTALVLYPGPGLAAGARVRAR